MTTKNEVLYYKYYEYSPEHGKMLLDGVTPTDVSSVDDYRFIYHSMTYHIRDRCMVTVTSPDTTMSRAVIKFSEGSWEWFWRMDLETVRSMRDPHEGFKMIANQAVYQLNLAIRNGVTAPQKRSKSVAEV